MAKNKNKNKNQRKNKIKSQKKEIRISNKALKGWPLKPLLMGTTPKKNPIRTETPPINHSGPEEGTLRERPKEGPGRKNPPFFPGVFPKNL